MIQREHFVEQQHHHLSLKMDTRRGKELFLILLVIYCLKMKIKDIQYLSKMGRTFIRQKVFFQGQMLKIIQTFTEINLLAQDTEELV